MPRRKRPLDVLVVDDSAVMRQLLSALLAQESGVTVTTAADPLIAMRKMERFRPDVMVLDIEMPRMDGLTFLRKIMAESPLPVVICSSHAQRGTGAAIEALAQGAVEVIGKPMLGLKGFLEDSSLTLLDTLRAAAEARVPRRLPLPRSSRRCDVALPAAPAGGSAPRRSDRVVAVGASTGGPQALQYVLEAMPSGAPGIVVVQHMPEGFTGAFARRLDQICRVEVKEASDGDAVVRGRALIAPGNRHLHLVRRGRSFAVHVADGPLVSRHRPSVDVLFRSVARAAGRRAVGVILTGMGDDGAQGLGQMKQAGAVAVAQDAASCVVFGMPKAAIERVGVDLILPLAKIPEAILAGAGPTGSDAPRTVPNSTTRTRPGKS